MTQHLVRMRDGSQVVLSGDALNALDPTLWDAAEPAERERTVVLYHLTPEGNVGFSTIDRETNTQEFHPERQLALDHAASKNSTDPLMSIVALAIASATTPQRDASAPVEQAQTSEATS